MRCTHSAISVHAVLRCDDTITKALVAARDIVKHFKRYALATYDLHKNHQQMSMPEHRLVMEVSTRWNSTVDLIDRLLEQPWFINAILIE
jgi:hypothetical protein